MAKIALPEQVRIAKNRVVIAAASTLQYEEIPMEMGEDEVALLLAYQMIFEDITPLEGAHYRTEAYIWRKSQPKTYPTIRSHWAEDSDTITFDVHDFIYQGYGVPHPVFSKSWYKVLPYPVVLIRPPSLISYATGDPEPPTGMRVYSLCWYVLQKVTDEQLAKLMVKDHG